MEILKKNKLAIFDMDGTLFDTSRVNYASYKMALESIGITLDFEFFEKNCNGRYYKDFINDLVPGADEKLVELVHERKKRLYGTNLHLARKNKKLFDIAYSLRHRYYIALVTSASKKNTDEILAHFSVRSTFDLILTHNDVERAKPDPQGFLIAMEHFSCGAANTLIFEDSEVGVAAAKKTGASLFVVSTFGAP